MCSAKQAEKLLDRDGKPLTKSVEIRFPGQVETPLKAKVNEVYIDAENDIARFVLSCEIINGDVLRLNCADARSSWDATPACGACCCGALPQGGRLRGRRSG